MLLATALVCLSISHFRTSWSLHRTNDEVQRLRDEAGYLHISDPRKIHVVGVRTHEDMLWKWRVYLPEGRRYELHSAMNEIPRDGFPKNHGSSGVRGGGEFTLWLSIYRDYQGQWRMKRTTAWDGGSSSVTNHLSEEDAAWLVKNPGFSSMGVLTASKTFEPGEAVVLLRLCIDEKLPGGGTGTAKGPSRGVMLWIAPMKE